MSTGWSSEWLDFAYMDLSAAEHLLTMRPLPVEIICYHCEQAAEKFLKATLVQFDREPPKTHDLIVHCHHQPSPHFPMPLTICTSRTEWYALLTMAPPPPPPVVMRKS